MVKDSVMTTSEIPIAVDQPKAKKASSPRSSSTHPPFYEMVSDAIVTLKEKSGSSQYAIQKFAEEKHKKLPANFRKLLLVQLRRLVSSGKLVKVKNSFKLPATSEKKSAGVKRKAVNQKEKTAKVAKTSAMKSPSSKKALKTAPAKPKKMKRLSAVKSPATKKAASPAKKAIAKAKKMKKLSAVKSPAKKMSAKK